MRRHLFGLLATPLLAYPVMAGCMLLVDAWAGERLLSLYLRHEQRLLWDVFWSDYAAATPVMYLVVAAVVASFLLLRRFRSDEPGAHYLVLVLAAVGWAAAAYLTRAWVGRSHLAMLVSGALLGVPVALFTSGILRRQPERHLE